jgi:uncharacterized SAM-binding protein YcdF (DUF218 family)
VVVGPTLSPLLIAVLAIRAVLEEQTLKAELEGYEMSFYIEKLLPILIYPLGLALLLCIVAFALSFASRARDLRVSIAVAVTLLWLASTPVFADLLTGTLEEQNSSVPIETISPKDVVIVLGGGLAQQRSTLDATHMGPAGDRVMQAALLWLAGKAQTIIVSGGNLPWARSSATDADLAAKLLEVYGVPPDSIIVESSSRNTHENAINAAAIWRERHFHSGLLVTSATHMPRALASFRRAGLDVAPWPADFHGHYPLVNSVFDFLPDAGALEMTTTAIKEWLGLAVYRLRSWA